MNWLRVWFRVQGGLKGFGSTDKKFRVLVCEGFPFLRIRLWLAMGRGISGWASSIGLPALSSGVDFVWPRARLNLRAGVVGDTRSDSGYATVMLHMLRVTLLPISPPIIYHLSFCFG